MSIALQEEYQKEVQASFCDGLTGLYNHGFFQLTLDREIERCSRYGAPFVLALLDIDNFSDYNREHGALAGDRLLKDFARLIQECGVRSTDFAARLTKDRFAIVLIEITLQPAMEILSRLMDKKETSIDGRFSLSIGAVSFPGDAINREQLLEHACEALGNAKGSVLNKICFYSPEKELAPADNCRGTILVADDEPRNVKLMEAFLLPLGYRVVKAYSGEEALSLVSKEDVDLILLDIMMPGVDGYKVCRQLKNSEATRMIPVVMVTALDSVEAKIKGIEAGADDFITKPPNKAELLARTKSLVRFKKLNNNLTSIENVLYSLANIVEAKDTYTESHIQRVAGLAIGVGRRLGLEGEELEALKLGGILHDIGKIGVPTDILNKPGKLSDKEWDVMQEHSNIGYKICLPLKKTLGPALDIIRHHHEKLDGSGYPDGLVGDEISLPVRVMTVVDIFDALTTNRPYRNGLGREKGIAILQEEVDSGKLDHQVVLQLKELLSGEITGY